MSERTEAVPVVKTPVFVRTDAHFEMVCRQIAKIAHEANRHYRAAIGEDRGEPWNALDEESQESTVEGVKAVYGNPDITPKESHENWMARKLAEGWTWGETKDLAFKTHPDLLPYEELPDAQKTKDALFLAICRALLFGDSGAR